MRAGLIGSAADSRCGPYDAVMDTTAPTPRGLLVAFWALTSILVLGAVLLLLIIGPWAD